MDERNLGFKATEEMAAETPPKFLLGDLIEPMPGKIAVQIETKKEFTSAGLYIPVATARTIHEERATQGKVVAVGNDDDDDLESAPAKIKVGDTVLFGKYSGTKIEYLPDPKKRDEKEQVIVMQERDVLAILRSPAEASKLRVRS